ncbi:MAG: S8 family serine peptidase [Chitinophagales bacterium]
MQNNKNVTFNGQKISLQRKENHQVKPTSRGLNDRDIDVVAVIGGRKIVRNEDGTTTRSLTDGIDETPIYSKEGSNKLFIPSGELLLVFGEETSAEQQKQIIETNNLVFIKAYSDTRTVVKVATGINSVDFAAALEALPQIEDVEIDLDTEPEHYSLRPSEDLFPHQWHLENKGKLDVQHSDFELTANADAKVLQAWNFLRNYGSSNVKIAVNDRGFDIYHPDFNAPNKIVDTYSYWGQTPTLPQEYKHGTPCAGIAAAANNGAGTIGVAPNAKLMLWHGNSFIWSFFRQLVDDCIAKGTDILSLSWGQTRDDSYYPLNQNIAAELTRLATEGRNGKGTIILIAAGNEGMYRLNFLATHPNVIAVGASTSRDTHAGYSNMGEELCVTAPGGTWPIIAPSPSWAGSHWYSPFMNSTGKFANYTHFQGTSAATPLVAGVCALMLSANPNLTASEVKSILAHSADKIGHESEYDARGYSVRYGFGRVNALKAVQMAASGKTIPPMPSKTTKTKTPVSSFTPKPILVSPKPQVTDNEEVILRKAKIVNLGEGDKLNIRMQPKVENNPSNISRTVQNGDTVFVQKKANEKWWQLSDEFVYHAYVQLDDEV